MLALRFYTAVALLALVLSACAQHQPHGAQNDEAGEGYVKLPLQHRQIKLPGRKRQSEIPISPDYTGWAYLVNSKSEPPE